MNFSSKTRSYDSGMQIEKKSQKIVPFYDIQARFFIFLKKIQRRAQKSFFWHLGKEVSHGTRPDSPTIVRPAGPVSLALAAPADHFGPCRRPLRNPLPATLSGSRHRLPPATLTGPSGPRRRLPSALRPHQQTLVTAADKLCHLHSARNRHVRLARNRHLHLARPPPSCHLLLAPQPDHHPLAF